MLGEWDYPPLCTSEAEGPPPASCVINLLVNTSTTALTPFHPGRQGGAMAKLRWAVLLRSKGLVTVAPASGAFPYSPRAVDDAQFREVEESAWSRPLSGLPEVQLPCYNCLPAWAPLRKAR